MTGSDLVGTTFQEGVAVVRLHDPKTRNALSPSMRRDAAGALRRAAIRKGVRAIVLTGGEDHFVSGGDIRELADAVELEPVEDDALWRSLAEVRVPVVAAVAGHALGGGCELALACDLVVAGARAVFGLPELSLGIIPGAGGIQRWGRLVGRMRAAEAALAGARIDAWTAMDIGLVNRVVPRGRTTAGARALAREIVDRAPLAVTAGVDALRAVEEVTLSESVAADRARASALLRTEDASEGMTAFLEKRPPLFRGS